MKTSPCANPPIATPRSVTSKAYLSSIPTMRRVQVIVSAIATTR